MPTTGYLRQKNGRYYAVLNLYDSTGKKGLQSRTISARLNKY